MRRKGEGTYFIWSLAFTIIPVMVTMCGVSYLLWTERNHLDKPKLASLQNVVLILMIFTNPECLVLLPWLRYQLDGASPNVHPNKSVLKSTLLKLVEDVPQFVIQLHYATMHTQETSSVEWSSLMTTSVSLLYVITQKILGLLCIDEKPVPLSEVPFEEWQGSSKLKRFLVETPNFPPYEMNEAVQKLKARKVNTLGRLLDLSSEDNIGLKIGLTPQCFEQIAGHATTLNNHFNRSQRTHWKEEVQREIRARESQGRPNQTHPYPVIEAAEAVPVIVSATPTTDNGYTISPDRRTETLEIPPQFEHHTSTPSLQGFLASIQLEQYHDAFVENGVTAVGHLQDVEEEDIPGMKKLEFRRLRRALPARGGEHHKNAPEKRTGTGEFGDTHV